jgi:CheY-like chemotaxis protein
MSERRLLLADDSMTVQKVVQLTFAEEGIDVSIAGDGDSAMLDYAEFKPDIVLADVHMPGLSGYQVCERIKQDNGNIPVVLLVGSFEPFDEEEAKRVGADGSIRKPFQSIRQLIDTVSSLLSSDRAPSTPDTVSDRADFAETIEIPSYQEIPSYPDGAVLGDSGMDDEMIETMRVDDTGEPETDDEPEPYDEPAPATAEARSFENGEEAPDYNLERVIDESDGSDESDKSDVPVELDNADAPDESNEPAESDEPGEEEHAGTPPEVWQTLPAPIMELDDMNFLEIPVACVPVLPPVHEEASEPLLEDTAPSPEFIESVAQRVVEKLCGDSLQDVIREAVREVYAERSRD